MTPLAYKLGEGSRFQVVPDPPVAGKPLEVIYVGPATEVEFQVDGHKPIKVKPDKNGRFKIASVPSGDEIMFSDNRGLPGYLHKKIVLLD